MEKELENYEDEEELVNVDGTKVKLSGKVLKVRFNAYIPNVLKKHCLKRAWLLIEMLLVFFNVIIFNFFKIYFLACRWNSTSLNDIEGTQAGHAQGQCQAEEGGNSWALRLPNQ